MTLETSTRRSLRSVTPQAVPTSTDPDAPRCLQRFLALARGQWELDRDHLIPVTLPPPLHRAPAIRLVRAIGEVLRAPSAEAARQAARDDSAHSNSRPIESSADALTDPPGGALRLIDGCGFVLARNPLIIRVPFVAVLPAAAEVVDGLVEEPPTIAIEVMAWKQDRLDLGRRVEQYIAAGVSVVWIVDGIQDVLYVFRSGRRGRVLERQAVLVERHLLPNFCCPLSNVFVQRRREPLAA